MPVGKIKKLVQEKGFGFISQTEGEDVFFHHTSVRDQQFEDLSVGQSVDYQIDPNPSQKGRGPRASSVAPM
jgi:cold shock protein